MRIQHNIMAMNAYRNYNTNTSALSKNLEKLSSGYKINRAGDDAAGLAISEKMRAQITGLNAAQKNVKDGISLVKTAEGAMQEIQDMLNRMDYLATQSANGTYDNEVDRLNLQKEVNQLRSEINRIADSSNFNGIKLLDGKLGFNSDAFTIGSVDAVEATDGKLDISGLLAKEADGSPKVHMETESAKQVNASAIIDLGDLEVTAAATGDTATLKLTALGKEWSLSLTGKTTYSKTDIASALQTAIQADANAVKAADGQVDGTATNNNAYKIGDNVYQIAADAAGLKVTLAGTFTGTTYKAVTATPTATSNEFNETQAKQINSDLGFDVKVGDLTGATGKTGDVIHKATNVEQAVAYKDASKAGIDITLSKELVTQGGSLTIDNKTFVFQTDAATTPTGGTVIDVSKAKTDDERLHMAADLLSKQTVTGQDGRTWKIGVSGGDGKTIHIDQTVASTAGKELKTYDDVVSKISASVPATAAKNIGTSIKITEASIKEGDMLTIGDKTFIFADKESTTVPEGAKKIGKTGVAAALKSALGTNAELDPTDNTKVIVRAAKEGEMAPAVVGKGLQLQIGDTADSYNQLQVKIGDMHTVALGIDKLSISDPESAAKAISTIRNAINYVSGIRGDLGATQNRLEHTANNLSVMAENIQDAESTIRDTDVAEEMMAYTKNNILVQSAQAMLAQANQVPQGVLQLLG